MKSLPKTNPSENLEEPILTENMRKVLVSMDADQLNLVMALLERFGIEGVEMEELLDIRQEIRMIIRRKKIAGSISHRGSERKAEDLGKNAEIISLFKKRIQNTPDKKADEDTAPDENVEIKAETNRPHLKLIK